MGFRKTHDLAVKVGTYENSEGETKGRYENCGMILKDEEGRKMLMVNPRFNFAGVDRDEGRDLVIVSMFETKQKPEPATEEEEDW
jgi:hypothetical protein